MHRIKLKTKEISHTTEYSIHDLEQKPGLGQAISEMAACDGFSFFQISNSNWLREKMSKDGYDDPILHPVFWKSSWVMFTNFINKFSRV